MRRLMLTAAALAAAASSAMAADLPRRSAAVAPAPVMAAPPVFTWTGFYVGAQAGYAWNNVRTNVAFPAVGPQFNSTPGSFFGGLHAGYNQQFGSFVAGLEGDFGVNALRSTTFPAPGLMARQRTDWEGSLRARMGVAFDRALIYATGGVAFANFRNDVFAPAGVASTTSTRAGWTIGAGVEYAIDNNWSTRLEYRYANFGSRNTPFLPAGLVNNRTDEHSVRAGLSYRFGAPAAPVLARY